MKRRVRLEVRKHAAGAFTVEFAIVGLLFFALLVGAMEWCRTLYVWNSAVESTRHGARTAAIVAVGDTNAVWSVMSRVLPRLQLTQVAVEYSADGTFAAQPVVGSMPGCGVGTCRFVRVSIVGYQHRMLFPAAGLTTIVGDGTSSMMIIDMPAFSTTAPVEVLGAG